MAPLKSSKNIEPMFNELWKNRTLIMAAFMVWGVSEKLACDEAGTQEIFA